jgi:translation initiation factor IF-2
MERWEEEIGMIDHYYGKIHVAGIHVEHGRLKVGDLIHVKGHTSDFEEQVQSLQVNHADVREVGHGAHVGVPVHEKARIHDRVFIIHQ